MSQHLSENAFGFLPVPIIISEPAVDHGLGLAAQGFLGAALPLTD